MTAVLDWTVSTAEETERVAAELSRTLRPGDVVALDGELGSGKTSFVRGLAGGLGCDGVVNSPTFVRMQHYTGDGGELVHIDAYRFEGEADLAQLGWDELLDGRRAVIAIEWAARVAHALPERRVDVTLAYADGDARTIRIRDRRQESTTKVCGVCGQAMPAGAAGAFCSERCRGADLRRWLDGVYAIGSIPEDQDE
jgi:tRNA threonylcarbamoyladenosine biosynthesis protein TsaE